jgi:hypothetical protein
VPLATQRTEAALAAYRGASAPLASVLDARRAEIEARMDQLKLEMETARLWAQLNYLLPSQPGTPKAPHEQNPVLSAPRALAIPLAIVIAMAAGYGLYQLGMHRGMGQLGIARRSRFFPGAPAAAAADVPRSIAEGEDATRRHIKDGLKAGDLDPMTGRRILYYHDPMVPATSSTPRPSRRSWT